MDYSYSTHSASCSEQGWGGGSDLPATKPPLGKQAGVEPWLLITETWGQPFRRSLVFYLISFHQSKGTCQLDPVQRIRSRLPGIWWHSGSPQVWNFGPEGDLQPALYLPCLVIASRGYPSRDGRGGWQQEQTHSDTWPGLAGANHIARSNPDRAGYCLSKWFSRTGYPPKLNPAWHGSKETKRQWPLGRQSHQWELIEVVNDARRLRSWTSSQREVALHLAGHHQIATGHGPNF